MTEGLREPDYATPGRDFRNDWKPVPDPTLLTQQAVDRAKEEIRSIQELKTEIILTRLSGMDKATHLVNEGVNRLALSQEQMRALLREDVDRQFVAAAAASTAAIDKVEAVMREKFTGIDIRFAERDERTAQATQEARISLDAALAAAKEAVSEAGKATKESIAKSEAAQQKQADSTQALMITSIAGLNDKIDSLKERLSTIETALAQAVTTMNTRTEVKTEGKTDNRALTTIGIAIVGIILSVVLALTLKKG
jgi:ribosomal protein L7/L12